MPVHPGAPPHFFPPRLEVVVEKQNADGLPSYRRHQFPFDRLFGHESDGPTGATWWRIAAYHGDDPLFLIRVQHLGRTGARFLIKGTVEAGLLVAVAEPAEC